MKKLLTSFLTFFVLSTSLAQGADKIVVDSPQKTILIDKLSITSKTTIDEVIKALGEPERKETIAGKERIFAYDKLGLSFDIGNTGNKFVEAVAITYNPDNDKKVAHGVYKGALSIDGLIVSKITKSAELTSKTKLGEIRCFGTMCAADPKSSAGLALLLSYIDESQKEIGQIGFAFKK